MIFVIIYVLCLTNNVQSQFNFNNNPRDNIIFPDRAGNNIRPRPPNNRAVQFNQRPVPYQNYGQNNGHRTPTRHTNNQRPWGDNSRPTNGNFRNNPDWYRPRRPRPQHYRDFYNIFNDLDMKANSTAELEDINDDFDGRSIVAPGQYPHMAALGFKSSNKKYEFKCGGSLISDWFVITAAHCCEYNGLSPEIIKIGDIRLLEREPDSEPQRRRVAQIHIHPDYNSSLYYNDIALIQLRTPIEYTHFVRPIRLWARDDIPYEKVFTMGYGSTSFAQAPTNILTELDLSIVALDKCNSTMPQIDSTPNGIIESQVCAKDFEKNRDTCQGDSGGPLQLNLERRRRRRRYRYYLVGITSYGTFCRSQHPGVYTRVSSYIDWIASIVWPQYFSNF